MSAPTEQEDVNFIYEKIFTKVEPKLISCGCNRTPNSVSWSKSGNLIHAANNGISIVFLSEIGSRVITNRALHSDKVNCVKWLTDVSQSSPMTGPEFFLSGGVDKRLFLCKYYQHSTDNKVEVAHCFKDSQSSVVCCDGLVVGPNSCLVASASGDSYVRIYKPDKDHEKAIQSIKFGTGFILTINMVVLPGTNVPIMACAGDDMKIHVFVWQNNQFLKVITLPGHEDWIRGLEFATDEGGDLLLASCSQDCFVRIWRMSESTEFSITDRLEDEIKLKQKLFSVEINGMAQTYSVIVETVLFGHEGWVYGVHWQPCSTGSDGKRCQAMRILTASMDKTMIIWEPDADTGVWEEKLRVGEVGGNTLGLYGCQFSPDGNTILAHGYQGAFTVWHRLNRSDNEQWCRGVAVGGHFGDVTDVVWDPEGEFILSTGTDQTTRLFAPWKKTGDWYEMGRPQVHGYDLQCLAMIGRIGFASGADEKVIRVFQCPLNSLENLQNLANVDFREELKQRKEDGLSFAEGASVPALGLSNKAVFQDKPVDMYEGRDMPPSANPQYSESSFRPLELSGPPSEDNLLQNTLWPETQKLYGHGFEIFALAANPQRTVLASACKASKAEYAGIILWDTKTWQKLETLICHTLTVVQMEFSHTGDRLLSVSRDRTWALHHFNYTTGSVDKIAFTDKKTAVHSRIIWSCAWTFDDCYFLTASRDKKIVFWSRPENVSAGELCTNGYEARSQPVFKQPVTAVCVAPILDNMKRYLVAAGMENGEIILCSWNLSEGLVELQTLDTSDAHHLTVRRLKFRPKVGAAGKSANDSVLQLASCGEDHQVRVYNITTTLTLIGS